MFREFHTLGAATGKAREENTVVAGGCCSNKAEVDRRFLIGRYLWRLWERYAGCPDCLALYVMVTSLYAVWWAASAVYGIVLSEIWHCWLGNRKGLCEKVLSSCRIDTDVQFIVHFVNHLHTSGMASPVPTNSVDSERNVSQYMTVHCSISECQEQTIWQT